MPGLATVAARRREQKKRVQIMREDERIREGDGYAVLCDADLSTLEGIREVHSRLFQAVERGLLPNVNAIELRHLLRLSVDLLPKDGGKKEFPTDVQFKVIRRDKRDKRDS